jgi:hypothetical protein
MQCIELSISNTQVEMELTGTGLILEKRNKIVMAENCGKLVVGGTAVAESNKKKYAIKSLDGQSLVDADKLILYPYEPMTIMVDRRYTKVEVTDAKGSVLDSVFLYGNNHSSLLDINGDMTNYRLLLS